MEQKTIHCGLLTICSHSKTATIAEYPIALTPLEFKVLTYLAQNKCRPVSPEELLDAVWECAEGGTLDQVRSCIKRIRKKLSDLPNNCLIQRNIHTVHGWGYCLCMDSHHHKNCPH